MASASAPLGVPPPPNARRQHKARCGQRDRQAAADGEGSDLEQICPTVEGAACNGAHPHMASPPKEVAPSLRNEDPMSFQTGTASCSSMLATWIFLTGFGPPHEPRNPAVASALPPARPPVYWRVARGATVRRSRVLAAWSSLLSPLTSHVGESLHS